MIKSKQRSQTSYIFLHLALICIAIIPFSQTLSKLNSVFLYSDEMSVVCLLMYMIMNRPFKDSTSYEKGFFVLYGIFVTIGLIGNFVSGMQSHAVAIALGIFGCLKFTATFFIILYYYPLPKAQSIEKRLMRWMQIGLLITILFYFFNLLWKVDKESFSFARYGIPALTFFCHPSNIASVSCAFASFFYYKHIQGKCSYIWVIMSMVTCALSLRAKAVAIVLVFLYALIFFKKRISVIPLVVLIGIVTVIVWPSIEYYYLQESASRAVLLRTSLDIAKNGFPIGSGFNTFGTMLSGRYYSGIYYQYGLSNRWGFSPNAYSFLTDGGYATIIAEFGWIGFVVFLGMILLFICSVSKRLRIRCNKIPILLLIIYMLLAQTNEQSMASNYAPLYAALLAIEMNGYIAYGETITQNKVSEKVAGVALADSIGEEQVGEQTIGGKNV